MLDKLKPRDFLPEELATFVESCQEARAKGDSAGLAALLENRPLKGLLNQLVLVDHQQLKLAKLPSVEGGMRGLPGCQGLYAAVTSNAR